MACRWHHIIHRRQSSRLRAQSQRQDVARSGHEPHLGPGAPRLRRLDRPADGSSFDRRRVRARSSGPPDMGLLVHPLGPAPRNARPDIRLRDLDPRFDHCWSGNVGFVPPRSCLSPPVRDRIDRGISTLEAAPFAPASLRPRRRRRAGANRPLISESVMSTNTFALVTTCWNENSSVNNWISDVKGQTRRPDQIWIVDAGSKDGTLDALRAWEKEDSRVRIVLRERCNVAEGRNLAIRNSTTSHVASTDMGCRLDARWLEAISEPFDADSTLDVVAGNYAADMSTVSSPAARAAFYMNDGYHPRLEPGFLPSSRSIAYRRGMWDAMEGYPEDLTLAADDSVFALQFHKMGFRMGFAPQALCLWRRHSTMKAYWKESFVYARGNGEAGLQTPAGMSPNSPDYARSSCYARALYAALTHNKRAILEAVSRLEFRAAALLPVMTFGMVLSTYRGYSVGVAKGIEKCQGCRARWM
jgi:GT2 family glycosyltransferase